MLSWLLMARSLFIALWSGFCFLKFLCSSQTPVIFRRLFGYYHNSCTEPSDRSQMKGRPVKLTTAGTAELKPNAWNPSVIPPWEM